MKKIGGKSEEKSSHRWRAMQDCLQFRPNDHMELSHSQHQHSAARCTTREGGARESTRNNLRDLSHDYIHIYRPSKGGGVGPPPFRVLYCPPIARSRQARQQRTRETDDAGTTAARGLSCEFLDVFTTGSSAPGFPAYT